MLIAKKDRFRTWVKPKNSINEQFRLSHLDCYEDNFVFVFCYYYEKTQAMESLQDALQKAFEIFPFFAGRLQGAQHERVITCTGQGIPSELVYLDVSLAELFKEGWPKNKTQKYGFHIVPQIGNRANHPLIAFKLNQLREGGSILAVTFSHAIADGHSICRFFNAWAALARGESKESIRSKFYLDRDKVDNLVQPLGSADSVQATSPQGWMFFKRFGKLRFLSKVVSYLPWVNGKVFNLSGVDLERLKQGKKESSNAIVTALLWKIYAAYHSKEGESRIFFPMDVRHLLQTGDQHYFGNAVVHICFSLPYNEVRKMPLLDLAAFVRDQTKKRSKGAIEEQYAWLAEARLHPKLFSKVYASVDHFGEDLFFSNVSKLPYYDLDFGEGKPFYFTSPPPPAPKIFHLLPNPADRNGICVHINDYRRRLEFVETNMEILLKKKFSEEFWQPTPDTHIADLPAAI